MRRAADERIRAEVGDRLHDVCKRVIVDSEHCAEVVPLLVGTPTGTQPEVA